MNIQDENIGKLPGSTSSNTMQLYRDNPPTFLTARGVRKLTSLSESTI